LGHGQPSRVGNDRQQQQQPYPQHEEQHDSHSYFERRTGEPSPAHSIQTIPEGSTVRGNNIRISEKSPSPPHSSTTTTGTTTTPTSIGNASSGGEGQPKDPGPDFPRDSLSTQPQNPPSEDPSYLGMPRYAPQTASQQDPYSQQPTRGHSETRYNPANYPAALKLLVSNNVAGSIIGRAGQTISELQSQSSTRIKLSQTGDYYPGTQDRVCLVQGDPEKVKTALRMLLERLYMLQEHQHSQHMAWQLQRQKGAITPTFDFVVRLLVPSSSCGMIIGKSGSNIKYMEENTGVLSVRLSPKDSGETGYPSAAIISATSERVVTITGPSLESCLQCLCLIVDGMTSHPDISRYTNMTTSYSRIMSDAAAYGPPTASRPVLVPIPPTSPRQLTPDQAQPWDAAFPTSAYAPVGPTGSMPRRIASSPDLPGIMLSQRLSETPTPDRLAGFSPGLSYSPVPGPPVPPLYLIPQPGQQPLDPPATPETASFPHCVSAPDLLAAQLEQSMRLSTPPQPSQPSQMPSQLPHQSSSAPDYALVPQTPTMTAPGCFQAQVLVPDSMIGSILGRAGRTLTELQMLSGTRIRISQRGEYMPGTRSRIVTIRGPTCQCVWQAQYMMNQRMVLPPTAYPPSATEASSHHQDASQQNQADAPS